jgi:hypothetical protein
MVLTLRWRWSAISRLETTRKVADNDYTAPMNANVGAPQALDRLLESLSRCFDLNTARAVTELRQDEVVRRRMEELGSIASDGRLSVDEEREYDALIEVSDVIATLQLKARQQLAGTKGDARIKW